MSYSSTTVLDIFWSVLVNWAEFSPMDREIGPHQVFSLSARVDLRTMVIIKGYSEFSKALVLLEPHHQIV